MLVVRVVLVGAVEELQDIYPVDIGAEAIDLDAVAQGQSRDGVGFCVQGLWRPDHGLRDPLRFRR